MSSLFHLAFPVTDLAATRRFYGEVLGCQEGRSAERWIDFAFFGHQISAHLVDSGDRVRGTNPVDGDAVPVPHFGAILSPEDYDKLEQKFRHVGIDFIVEPRTRFAGQPGEQKTMFIKDPSGNVLEFKSFADRNLIFAT